MRQSVQSRISCPWVFLKGAGCFETYLKTKRLRMRTLNCRRVACAINSAPNKIAILAARPGWSNEPRAATCFQGTQDPKNRRNNRRRDYESRSILRWFRYAYARIFRSFAQTNGADWVSPHSLARDEVLRPLRSQRLYFVFGLQGRRHKKVFP